MEGQFETSQPADLSIGGIPNEETRETKYAIRIPGLLSFLAHGDFNAEVIGLDQFPEEEWPPVLITHVAFQIMVACGFLMMFVGLIYFFILWKKKGALFPRWFLWLVGICTPLGFIAVEAGWTVTEVGRQPWIIYGIMKTEDAVSSMPGLQYPFFIFTGVYLLLTFVVTWLMYRQIITLPDRYESAKPIRKR